MERFFLTQKQGRENLAIDQMFSYIILFLYTGALACYTVAFTSIGTTLGVVLGKIVDKSRAENTSPNGKDIVFAAAEADGFTDSNYSTDSPPI